MKRFCALVLLLCAAWAPSEAKIKLPAIVGFELAGSDGVFRPAKAVRRRPDPTVLYVSNYDVGNPVYLRYNFKNCSVGRLWDAFGQPVVPFRTDNF